MNSRFAQPYGALLKVLEQSLALIVLVGVVIASLGSAQALLGMDWRAAETLYEFIYRVLLVVIGVELARMLVTHDLMAVLELLAFVIARKMLKPDLSVVDVALGVFAFAVLLLARQLVLRGHNHPQPD